MSADEDLERILQRYRPVGPPDELRHRVGEPLAQADARPARSWSLPAAAAAAAIVLYALAANVRDAAMPERAAENAARQTRLIELTTTLGGDAIAREAAEHLMELEEQIARAERAREPEADIEGVPHE